MRHHDVILSLQTFRKARDLIPGKTRRFLLPVPFGERAEAALSKTDLFDMQAHGSLSLKQSHKAKRALKNESIALDKIGHVALAGSGFKTRTQSETDRIDE